MTVRLYGFSGFSRRHPTCDGIESVKSLANPRVSPQVVRERLARVLTRSRHAVEFGAFSRYFFGLHPRPTTKAPTMDPDVILLIVYLVVAIGFSFYCSVAEAVLLSISPSFIATLSETKPADAETSEPAQSKHRSATRGNPKSEHDCPHHWRRGRRCSSRCT